MSNLVSKNEEKIENLIYEIRGKQVMLDSDLARLYKCANGTKDINKAVKRNLERFPERFMFQLTNTEYQTLKFQLGTSSIKGGRRYNPYVFTEQGVAMLSAILRSEIAVEISIKIMDAFVAMRKYISNDLMKQKYINNMVLEHDSKIKLLQYSFDKLEEKQKINDIYFDGQIYDAYSKIFDIFKHTKKELIIIDSYADNTILDIIKRLNIKVTIITRKNNLLTVQDIEKYNKQYQNLTVKFDSTFHDRYFILDNKTIYHCGASINRIGYKTFSITLIKDKLVTDALINRVKEITK